MNPLAPAFVPLGQPPLTVPVSEDLEQQVQELLTSGEPAAASDMDLPIVVLQGPNQNMEPLSRYGQGGLHPVHLNDVINNQYSVLAKLGNGGYGTVWLCRDTLHHRYVSVKINVAYKGRARATPMDVYIGQLDRSVPGGECFEPPLDVFDLTGPNGVHLVIVTRVHGPTVSDYIWRYIANEYHGQVLRRIARQSVDALHFLHSNGIYHGDFRPNNILLSLTSFDHLPEKEVLERLNRGKQPSVTAVTTALGGLPDESYPIYLVKRIHMIDLGIDFIQFSIRVIDFGLAGFLGGPQRSLCLPRPYAPPDWLVLMANALHTGKRPVTELGLCGLEDVDKWSLACTLSEIRLQEPLFRGSDPSMILRDIVNFFGKLPEPLWVDWMQRDDWFEESLLLSYEPGSDGASIPQIRPRIPDTEPRIHVKATAAMTDTKDRLYTLDWALRSMFKPDELESPSKVERDLLADLLRKMCASNTSERLQLAQVLEHDWFKM